MKKQAFFRPTRPETHKELATAKVGINGHGAKLPLRRQWYAVKQPSHTRGPAEIAISVIFYFDRSRM